MIEKLLSEREVSHEVARTSKNSPLNERYNLRRILETEPPSSWQRLASELSKPLRDYIKQEFRLDMKVAPVVPESEVFFECMPYFMSGPLYDLFGIRMREFEKTLVYLTAAFRDIAEIPKILRHNREHPEKEQLWKNSRELDKAFSSGGKEFIHISEIPNYHTFVYVVAHEVGHSVAIKIWDIRWDVEKFPSTFGLNFMKWYMAQPSAKK